MTENRTSYCECGERKGFTAYGCRRCMYLDGARKDAHVIDALRDGALPLLEVCHRIGEPRAHRKIEKVLRVLMERGRARRVAEPFNGRWRWIYMLDGAQ